MLSLCALLGVIIVGAGRDQQDEIVDVIIVGAGWAGLSAADYLVRSKQNVTFTVLEARNETGGRTRAMTFGDASVGRYVLERGSNWVCGVGGGTGGQRVTPPAPDVRTNPILDLALRAKLDVVLIPGSTQNLSNYAKVFGPRGADADADGALRNRAKAALDCVNATGHKAPGYDYNATLRQALTDCGWDPRTPAEWAVDWVATVDDPGFPASQQAARGWGSSQTYAWWGKDDYFVIDQNPRGYAKLLDVMVEDWLRTDGGPGGGGGGSGGDPRLVLGATVTQVAYDCDGVRVTLADGSVHRGRQAIVTFPLGVLQRQARLRGRGASATGLFQPPLPAAHVEALTDHGAVMANLSHVLLQFPASFDFPPKWAAIPRWVSAVARARDSAASGEFCEWQNLDHETLLPGSRTLLSFLGDPQSSRYEGQPDAVAQAAAMKALRAQNPELSIPDPVAFFISRHGFDPLSYGAYSGFEPGWRDKYMRTLQTPLRAAGACSAAQGGANATRVRFAGEAVCDDFGGFTHGGRQSGVEVAAWYLYEQGKGPDPSTRDELKLCAW
jgi:hypothetical protein